MRTIRIHGRKYSRSGLKKTFRITDRTASRWLKSGTTKNVMKSAEKKQSNIKKWDEYQKWYRGHGMKYGGKGYQFKSRRKLSVYDVNPKSSKAVQTHMVLKISYSGHEHFATYVFMDSSKDAFKNKDSNLSSAISQAWKRPRVDDVTPISVHFMR